METAQNFSETFTGTVPTGQGHVAESVVSKEFEDQTAESNLSSETPPTPYPEFETGPGGSVRIPLDQIVIDGSISPRVSRDPHTVKQYAAALIRGEHLPPITVEKKNHEYRVLNGVPRFQAYWLRRDVYTKNLPADFYDEPLSPISETELNTIPCFVDSVPPDIPAIVYCLLGNRKHGKPLTSEDYEMVARKLYQDNLGASSNELAKSITVSRKVFDLVEAFEADKKALILEVHSKGVSQAEKTQILKELFPKAKRLSQSQISEFLLKNNTVTKTATEDEDLANAYSEEVSPNLQNALEREWLNLYEAA